MNWLYGAAAIMVAVAVVLRLLWWARSHRLASQQQALSENRTEVAQTAPVAEDASKK
ncbi:MAG: hypothetical protein QUS33_01000 [Dehalococcoidia bacterium]|nr:hypothetical protein [Dehalococcoidia bacterium]